MSSALPLDLTLDAIDHPGFAARQVALRLTGGGAADLDIGRLRLGTRELGRVRLRCGEFAMTAERVACRRGELRPAQGVPLPLSFSYQPAHRRLELDVREADLASVALLMPELAPYHPVGRLDARLTLTPARADIQMLLHRAAFADTEGRHAGDKLEASATLAFLRQRDGWRWQAEVDWPSGELYLAPLYRAGGVRLSVAGSLMPGMLSLDSGRLSVAGVGTLDGTLRWQPGEGGQPGRLVAAEVVSGPLDLARLVPEFVQPYLDLRAGAKLEAGGTGRLALVLDADGLSRLDVGLTQANIVGAGAALQGVDASIPWRREAASQAEIHVGGGRLGQLPLGAFNLPLAMRGHDYTLSRVEIPLLDGKLLFEDFHAVRIGDAWQWRLAGALEPVSMPLLTQVLGWPKMSGLLSASIPRISYADATLALDGQLVVALFDGYLSATGLRVVEPFGALPRVQADFEARHLDLGMLTETFSFGDITGYVDVDVNGLEMAGVRPLAFDARVRSTPGDYRKRISQRAVQNISSLGGAGAGAAIQRSFLRVFETFGYDRIGLSCHLVNETCLMGGLDSPVGEAAELAGRLGLPGTVGALPAHGYMIVKGGGVPSLNVIGYNRRVHWDELVSRLKAVIAGNSKIEIR